VKAGIIISIGALLAASFFASDASAQSGKRKVELVKASVRGLQRSDKDEIGVHRAIDMDNNGTRQGLRLDLTFNNPNAFPNDYATWVCILENKEGKKIRFGKNRFSIRSGKSVESFILLPPFRGVSALRCGVQG
jgi:hypothetical protein